MKDCHLFGFTSIAGNSPFFKDVSVFLVLGVVTNDLINLDTKFSHCVIVYSTYPQMLLYQYTNVPYLNESSIVVLQTGI